MNGNLKRLVPIFCAGMFIYSGCTKQQSVKTDPSIAPSVATGSASMPAPAQPGQSGTVLPEKAASASVANASSPSAAGQAGQPIAVPATKPESAKVVATADAPKGFEKIYFDFDSSALSEPARQTLTGNLERLKENPRAKLRIEGHCDERGSDEYNLALSERRAQAALKYLAALGIAEERLSAIGYGEEKPADPGHDQTAWDKNRRDEFNIVK